MSDTRLPVPWGLAATLVLWGAVLSVTAIASTGPPGETETAAVLDETEHVLAQRVILPFRVWDSRRDRYVTDPAHLPLNAFFILEQIPLEDDRIRTSRPRYVRQKALSVDLERRPLSVAIVVDVSDSMTQALPFVREAAGGLVERLKPRDRAVVLTFSDGVVLESDLTRDRGAIRRALAGLSARGNTALYDAVHAALDKLRRIEDPRAIVVVTDGTDNSSVHTLVQVQQEALEARIPLFFVYHLVSPRGYRKLTEAALETGGRVFHSNRDENLIEVFDAIADGLRHTFILSYRSSNQVFDGTWREVEVRLTSSHWKLQTPKNGYQAHAPEPVERPGEGDSRVGEDRAESLPLPDPPPPGDMTGPLPDILCVGAFSRTVRRWCREEMTAEHLPGDPPALRIRGWVDMAHEAGALMHPTRYGADNPLPPNPREAGLRMWNVPREYARLESLLLPLPAPERLPRSPGELWSRILTEGAVFRTAGMVGRELGGYEAGERAMVIPPLPGMTPWVEPASRREDDAGGGRTYWWLNGGLALTSRDLLSRWIFRASPAYQEWVRDRFEATTRRLVEQEVAILERQVPPERLPEIGRHLAGSVERTVRRERRLAWGSIVEGREGPTRDLLVWRRDLRATEWMDRAEAVLVDRLLEHAMRAGHPRIVETLKGDWIDPARRIWSRLRTFLAPTAHHSLTLAHPVLDPVGQEIYLPRVLLPWIEVAPGGGGMGGFPTPRPEALMLVAGLLRDPRTGPLLAGGAYRCPEDGLAVFSYDARDWRHNPPGWWMRLETLREERQRLRDAPRPASPPARRRHAVEQDLLGREIRTLRKTSGVHLTLRLERDDGSGLVLTRRGKDPVHARPLKDPGIVLEVADPKSFRSLEDALRGGGLDPQEPRVSNALLAARINGFDDETLVALLGPEGRLACLCPEGCGVIRLLFRPDDLGLPRPPRVVMEEGREVLEVNLAASPAVRMVAAVRSLCRGGNR